MKVIILAAGRGSRLNELTERRPKCMVEIFGKPILHWQLEAIATAGLKDAVIVCGYEKNMIEADCQKIENPRWAETNMVATLRCADAILQSESVIVSYSDIICHPNIISRLAQSRGDISITYDVLWHDLWAIRFENPLDDAETFIEKNGCLISIGSRAKSIAEICGQYMGLLKITPAGWRHIRHVFHKIGEEKLQKLDMTSLLQILLDEKTSVKTIEVRGGWVEVDSSNDLAAYESKLASSTRWSHDWRW